MATNWGILGCGRISNDFVSAMASLPLEEHRIVACAARSADSAQDFGTKHEIPKMYGSYEELVQDPEVQVVYIGTINPQHFPLAKLAMEHGKHVLCEKPLCMNVKETKQLIQIAKDKKVFLMEAIWSRFFPAYSKIREELANGTIGDVLQVTAHFGIPILHKDRIKLKEMGGGATLDIGVYCVQFASLVFGGQKPEKVIAAGHLNENGIDDSATAILMYPGGKTASIVIHGRVRMESEAYAIGTNGMIKVPMKFWCPTDLVLPSGPEHFDLPVSEKSFNSTNSVGLCYQAKEVRNCIQNKLVQSPFMSWDESIVIAEIMESIRTQVGVVYPQDA